MPALSFHQQPTDKQSRVAHFLRVNAKTRAARQQTILRVSREQFGRYAGRLQVSGRGRDETLQVFHVPAGADEFGREPVEQFGMCRPLALHAEVLNRLHDADAKELLPEAIHIHTGGERV